MSWVFGSDSTVVTGTGSTCTPNAPSVAWNPGDLLLNFFTEGFGSHTISAVSPWVDLTPHVNVTSSQYVFGRLAAATNDAMMTATWSASTNFRCYSMAFTGPATVLTVDTSADRAGNVTESIPGQVGNVTPSVDNCLAIYWGAKNKTSASNASTFSLPAGWTLQMQDVMAGSASALVAGYQIQTTASAIAPAQATGTVADATTQTAKMVVIVIQPPSVPSAFRALLGVGR